MEDNNKNMQGKPGRRQYAHRYLARIILQAETPLAVGSGRGGIQTDAMVMRDVNGLPFIPGTSLAGVLRHSVDGLENQKGVFGYQDKDDGLGSRLMCTSARMVGKDGHVVDGLQGVDYEDTFYKAFRFLPVRQHVRISERGTAEDGGKFDEEVVYKGTRFCCEIELLGEDKQEIAFFKNELLPRMQHRTFRIGGGTRNGLGEMSIQSYQERTLDLTDRQDLEDYLKKSSLLDDREFSWDEGQLPSPATDTGWTTYAINLTPDDFFLFGSGFGDDAADNTPVREQVVSYDAEGNGQIKEEQILIPASSVKGALSHRVAYHYNRLVGDFTDKPNGQGGVGKNNPAVRTLFGREGDVTSVENTSVRGKAIFSDLLQEGLQDKLLNHVAIDRFTGGTLAGALFSEKVAWGDRKEFSTLTIHIADDALKDANIRKAFECALDDLCHGLLPLGGGTNRGHGRFTGKWQII